MGKYQRTINQDDILFPKRLTVEVKLKEYEKISNVEKEIMTSATKIRGELKNSSYKINWPPKSQDLDVQSFPEFPLLQRFLVRLISDEVNPKTDRNKDTKTPGGTTGEPLFSILDKIMSFRGTEISTFISFTRVFS